MSGVQEVRVCVAVVRHGVIFLNTCQILLSYIQTICQKCKQLWFTTWYWCDCIHRQWTHFTQRVNSFHIVYTESDLISQIEWTDFTQRVNTFHDIDVKKWFTAILTCYFLIRNNATYIQSSLAVDTESSWF